MRKKKITSKIMSSIHSKNTEPENILSKAIWAKGLRYRKQYRIIGKPDFVLVSQKIAIFCDGDFWHGNNWRLRKLKNRESELSTYSLFWRNKITANIKRDKIVNKKLKKAGWKVIRFWESKIRKDIDSCIKKVLQIHDKQIKRERH